jgi:hypothetical protein
MKFTDAMFFVTMISLTAAGSSWGQSANLFNRAIPENANAAAQDSLNTFKELVSQGAYREYDFDSASSVDRIVLGQPLNDAMIGLDQLANWDGANPYDLIRPTGRVVFPITSDGQAHSSVTLAFKDGKWVAVAFGGVREARARLAIEGRMMRERAVGSPAPLLSQVRIPALNLQFLARLDKGQLFLTPVEENPELGLEAGREERADLLLRRAQQAASHRNPDVPD